MAGLALFTFRDSCGGTPISAAVLAVLVRVGPCWLQAQKATTTN